MRNTKAATDECRIRDSVYASPPSRGIISKENFQQLRGPGNWMVFAVYNLFTRRYYFLLRGLSAIGWVVLGLFLVVIVKPLI